MTAIEQPTIFIVDDDIAAQESMAAITSAMGLRSKRFSSAAEFLDAYDPSESGCLITDERMPGMSGIELLRTFQKLSSNAPSILITAYADVPLTVEAMQYEAVTVLEKPCQHQELRKAIRTALKREESRQRDLVRRRMVSERLASLTDQESQVMHKLLKGAANKSIASQLGIGIRTVEKRRHDILKKMQANTPVHLAYLIARYTQIEPDSP